MKKKKKSSFAGLLHPQEGKARMLKNYAYI